MIHHIDSNKRKSITKAFEGILIITLLFLLIYNPQLRIMSSGFTRYVFLFLIINLYGGGAIKRGTDFFVRNSGYIVKNATLFRYACYGMRFIAFLLSYLITTKFLSGMIGIIWGKGVAPIYIMGSYAALIALSLVVLEYAGIIKCAAFIALTCARGIRLRYSQASLFTGVLGVYWFCLTLFFLGIALLMNTYDFALPGKMMKVLLYIFPITFLTVSFLRKKGAAGFEELLRLFTYTVALQALFIMLDWFIPSFSNLLQSVVQKIAMSLRASGITGEAGDGLSLIQALGAISSFQLFMFSDNVKEKWLFAVLFVLQILSIAFVGRTGFVLVAVFIATSLLLNGHTFTNIFRLAKLGTISLIVCFSLYSLLVPPHIKIFMEDRFLPWAFEFVYSLAEKGSLETSSTTYIKESMLFLPDNVKTILIGDGFFQDPADLQLNYMGTDSGYVRFIFFAGIIGSFLFYQYFILMAALMYKISKDRNRVSFVFSSMAMFFVAQIKFPFMALASTHIFLLLLFFCLLNEHTTANCVAPQLNRRTI